MLLEHAGAGIEHLEGEDLLKNSNKLEDSVDLSSMISGDSQNN